MSANHLEPASAQKLTDQIRKAVDDLWELVVTAYQGRAWQALGYLTWDAYVQGEFGSLKIRIPKEERREICAHLRDNGLSLRAISTATGYDRRTVVTDLIETAPQLVPARSRSRVARLSCSPIRQAVTDLTKSGKKLAKLCDDATPADARGIRADLELLRNVLDDVIGQLEKHSILQ